MHRPAFSFALAATLVGPSILAAQTRPALDARAIDSSIAATMQQHRIAGASIAIVRDGQIALARGYGFASLDPRVPVDTGTRFCIGSVTKEFVSALTLLLQEEGKLSVHDTLAKWYPALTRAREVTLLDLMNHVSGYHDYYPLDFVDREMARPTTADRIIQEYATQPLDFDPGTRWSYSNTGYAILGRVLERVTGQPLGVLLAQHIFQPLGMRQTEFEHTRPDRRATGYLSWALGDPQPALLEGAGWLGAAGGIWSTPSDLARWDLALMRPGFLSPASRAVLFGERVLRDGSHTGYAAGLQVEQTGGRTIYQHGGASAGFVASNVFVPADSAAVIVLVNGDQGVAGVVPIDLVSAPRAAATVQAGHATAMRPAPPAPRGAPADQAATAFFGQLQQGQVDRARLGADYAATLTPERVAEAARSLAPLGPVTRAQVLSRWERGGMEASVVRLTTAGRAVIALMYRSPAGSIEEYLLW